MANLLRGPDVSDWQGDVDWTAVRASGRPFAFTKATEGTRYVADTLYLNRWTIAGAGLVLCGLYHFAGNSNDGTLGDPVAEADHFLSAVDTLMDGECAVLDLEIGDQGVWVEWARTWLERVEDRLGRLPVLYLSDSPARQLRFDGFQRYPLWVAGYGPNDGEPPDWGSYNDGDTQGLAWPRWTFWQYSSQAVVPGIAGRCDDNLTTLDEAGLAALGGGRPQRRSTDYVPVLR